MLERCVRVLTALAAIAVSAASGLAQSGPRTGRNLLPIRDHAIDCYYYPASDPAKALGRVVFAPGDGGWRGVAVTMGETVASWGYDVLGFDTKSYLESFTGESGLREADVMGDIRQVANWMAPGDKVYLVGWSEGAGLVVLAAASDQRQQNYRGVVTMGLEDPNVLGWRWRDDLSYVTRARPNEPGFSSLAYIDKIAPLPLFMLQSAGDEYVALPEARKLFDKALEPKRFALIAAQDHRFDGNQQGLYQQLRAALEWIGGVRP